MTYKPKDGGPAWPIVSGSLVEAQGMSLRDWLAGQALTGILSRDDIVGTEARLQHVKGAVAELSYAYADAMLEARK